MVCFHTVYCILTMSCSMFEGDVNPEEIFFFAGLLPGEAAWRFLLPYWGTYSVTTAKATVNVDCLNTWANLDPHLDGLCGVWLLFLGGGWWWQWFVRLWWWDRWEERCPGRTLLHAHRRDLWTQRKWVVHGCLVKSMLLISSVGHVVSLKSL